VGLEPAVEPVSWESVLNLWNVYSSAFQTVLRIKIWDTHWCWGIHLNLVMPGKDSTALSIELALDENLIPFPMSQCSEPFHSGRIASSVCGGPSMKFPISFYGFSLSLLHSEPPWVAPAHRQWSLSFKMCTRFNRLLL
jgi:hypothetical protein